MFENHLEYCVHHSETSVHFCALHLKKEIERLELEMGLEQKSYEEELGLFSLEKSHFHYSIENALENGQV